MQFKRKTKVVVCTICGAAMLGAVCYHLRQVATNPLKASNIETTTAVPGLAELSSDTGVTNDITTTYYPTLETYYRTDMPKIPGVVIKPTKPSSA